MTKTKCPLCKDPYHPDHNKLCRQTITDFGYYDSEGELKISERGLVYYMMNLKKELTHKEVSSRGGFATAKKMTKEQRKKRSYDANQAFLANLAKKKHDNKRK